LADLGSWLDGAYRISQPVAEEELDEGIAQDESSTEKPH
jgi:endogenous inhibitor of DNA gyrase (YacG/DUF329 family)